jgi:ABC-type branched-subunit amino acid transport system permease subunit
MALMFDVILRVGLLIATGFLSGIILLAYLRVRSIKLLLFTIGFGLFFVHAILYMPELMIGEFTFNLSENVHIFLNLVALVFITAGILKEKE